MEQKRDYQKNKFEIGDLVYLKSLEPSWFLNDTIGIILGDLDQLHHTYLVYVSEGTFLVHRTALKNIEDYENVLHRNNND